MPRHQTASRGPTLLAKPWLAAWFLGVFQRTDSFFCPQYTRKRFLPKTQGWVREKPAVAALWYASDDWWSRAKRRSPSIGVRDTRACEWDGSTTRLFKRRSAWEGDAGSNSTSRNGGAGFLCSKRACDQPRCCGRQRATRQGDHERALSRRTSRRWFCHTSGVV